MKNTVEIQFSGNLETAILKMKKIKNKELEPDEILYLKCCLLFLCGMSYSKIQEKTGTYREKISKLLNNEKLEGLLSLEYQILLEQNKYRLQPNKLREEKIKKAVTTFVEKSGNYKETMQQTSVSDRSLSRYFSNANLEEILEDETLYNQFLETKKNAKRNLLKPRKICMDEDEKKYTLLVKAILDGANTLEALSEETNIEPSNIDFYIENLPNYYHLFTKKTLELLKIKLKELTLEPIISTQNQYQRWVLTLYMKCRYSYQEFCDMLKALGYPVSIHLIEEAKYILTEEELQAFQKHKREVAELLKHKKRNQLEVLIQDAKMIEIVKPEILFVDRNQYRVLKMITTFLESYDDKTPNHPAFQSMISCLSKEIEPIYPLLKKEAAQTINHLLTQEQLLQSNELYKKNEWIKANVTLFFKKHLDIKKTATIQNIPPTLLIKILRQPFVQLEYGYVVSSYIELAIKNFIQENHHTKNLDEQDILTKNPTRF